jgi:hypothetical protein
MQLDESTDITNLAELLVYVRYIQKNTIEEKMLFCKSLRTTTTDEDIFNEVTSYFTKNRLNGKYLRRYVQMELQLLKVVELGLLPKQKQ